MPTTHSNNSPAPSVATLAASGRLVDAESIALSALPRHPRDERLLYEFAHVLIRQGRAREAVDLIRDSLARDPAALNLRMILAFAFNYDDRAAPDDAARAHLRYGALLRQRVGRAGSVPRRERGKSDRTRLLFVSADLFAHSVGYFLEPLVRELRAIGGFELTFAHVGRASDETTARLCAMSDAWLSAPDQSHEALTRTLRERNADIAIDLSGLSAGHRMPVFARRIAPVQATYLGYPGGTGVDTIDARIADSWTDPPSEPNLLGERIMRLGSGAPRCFLCYMPPREAPGLFTPSPARPDGDETVFGCFGNLSKLNPSVLLAWSAILKQAPRSRLILKNHALRDESMHARVAASLRNASIDPARVTLLPASASKADHFAAYHQIDVALDTFPYNGTTTTCEALVMGVPVVTFAGDRHASRVGLSLLNAVGEPSLCAADEDAYTRTAVSLAEDQDRLRSLHATLRDRLLASPVCDAASHAREFAATMTDLLSR